MRQKTVVLQPGQVWNPGLSNNLTPFESEMEKETTPEKCDYHVYRKVTLFRTTVEECKKCGKLKDEK